MKDWWRYVDQRSGDDPEPVKLRGLWVLLERWNIRGARSVRYRLMGGFSTLTCPIPHFGVGPNLGGRSTAFRAGTDWFNV